MNTLLGETGLIVDLTCSTKRTWPRVADKRLDVNPDVKPDQVWDGLHIPFGNSTVWKLYYDPPYYIGAHGFDEKPTMGRALASRTRKRNPHQHFLHCMARMGFWESRQKWEDALLALNLEAMRVLEPKGELHVKLGKLGGPNKSVQRNDTTLLGNFDLTDERVTTSRYGKNETYWLTFSPKQEDGRA